MHSDIYYHPDRYSLEILAEVKDESIAYTVKHMVVWRHITTGELFWGSHTWCTCCQEPFEDHSDCDLIKLTPGNWNCLELATFGYIGCGEVPPGLVGRVDAMLKLAYDTLHGN